MSPRPTPLELARRSLAAHKRLARDHECLARDHERLARVQAMLVAELEAVDKSSLDGKAGRPWEPPSDATIAEIRRRLDAGGESLEDIARAVGVSRRQVTNVRDGKGPART